MSKRAEKTIILPLLSLIALNVFIFYIIITSTSLVTNLHQKDDKLTFSEKCEITLNIVMKEIEKTHLEASPYIKENMTWTKIVQEINEEYPKINYTSDGWKAIIGSPRTSEAIYEVQVEHDTGIYWEGTIEDTVVMENKYEFNITKPNSDDNETDLKTMVMRYVIENHPEVADIVKDPGKMRWELASSIILQGYSEFVYTSNGWNMTMGYAITAEPYRFIEIQLENEERSIKWIGIIKDETIQEKSFQIQN